jgi:hypothetical protein
VQKLRILSILILLPFTALTAFALWDVGLVGLFVHQAAKSSGVQVFTDLVIALTFFMIWMVPHAKRTHRNPWLYVAITLALGSFGPLLYFALARGDDTLTAPSS